MDSAEKLRPVEFKVLVELDQVGEREGSLFIPATAKERAQYAQVTGTLLKVGGNAFEDWKDPVPKPGDRVWIAKYAGYEFKEGERFFRLCNDKDVTVIVMN